MKCVVTGGAGFIGSNLTERLVREGHDVTVIDNFHTGSRENLSDFIGKINLIESDAGKISKLGLSGIDAIFHLGIYSSAPMYKENPALVGKAISEAIELFEYSYKNNIKVVWASSSSVYNGLNPPHRENMEIKVTDYYTEVRIAMERLALLYSRMHSLDSVALRFFSVYGPREKAKGKYANLVTQFLLGMKKGIAPVIFGDGTQTRDFIYVSDVVKGIIRALEKGKPAGIYNIGTGKNYSLNELVGKLNEKLGSRVKPEYVENKIKNYVQHTRADTKKSEKELGFKAGIQLDEGIEKLIEYYK